MERGQVAASVAKLASFKIPRLRWSFHDDFSSISPFLNCYKRIGPFSSTFGQRRHFAFIFFPLLRIYASAEAIRSQWRHHSWATWPSMSTLTSRAC